MQSCGIILTSDEKDLQGFKSALFIHSPGLAVVSSAWKIAAWGKHVMSCLYREGELWGSRMRGEGDPFDPMTKVLLCTLRA